MKIYLTILFGLNLMLGVLSIGVMSYYIVPSMVHEQTIVRNVAGSGSMKPFIDKRVYPFVRTESKVLSYDEKLYLGKVYIYNRSKENNQTLIIHRLVGVWDLHNETYYVFMGDNNPVVDNPINRSQIIEEVKSVYFE